MYKLANIELKYEDDLRFVINANHFFCEKADLDFQGKTRISTSISEICRSILSNNFKADLLLKILTDKKNRKYFCEFCIVAKDKSVSNHEILESLPIKNLKTLTGTVNHELVGEKKIHVSFSVIIPDFKKPLNQGVINNWKNTFKNKLRSSPLQELKVHNSELIEAYKTIKEKEESLNESNRKLENALKQIETKNEELRDFAHTVAHDLKSPLNAILMSAEMITTMYRDELSDELLEIFEINVTSSNKMKELINRYLSYATASAYEDKLETIDTNEIIEEIYSYIAKPREVNLTYNNLPNVYFDLYSFQLIFQNLITNAVKYNDKDVIEIEIVAKKEEDRLVFSVKDNGPGIPKDKYEMVFEPYKMLDIKSNTEKGTGLGLPLVKKIIERNNGEIWVESVLGESATFCFSIPIKKF